MSFLGLADNKIGGVLNPSAFDNKPKLTHIDVNTNQIRGSLPTFVGCTGMESIDVSSNQLSGTPPRTWGSMQKLHSLFLQNNQLESPISVRTLISLKTVDISHNRFNTTTYEVPIRGNVVGTFIEALTTSSLTTLRVNHNQLVGQFSTADFVLGKTLKEVSNNSNGFMHVLARL